MTHEEFGRMKGGALGVLSLPQRSGGHRGTRRLIEVLANLPVGRQGHKVEESQSSCKREG